MIDKNSTIYITGHKGFVGKNLFRRMATEGYNVLCSDSKEVDLRNPNHVEEYFKNNKPEMVINLAAKVGGILKNIEDPFHFLYDNLMIQSNIINYSIKYEVKKVITIGSSCIFPSNHPIQPLTEEHLLDGKLEPTNEGYSLAKIVGLKLSEYANRQTNTKFISLMPSNLYGPYDHFDLKSSHALAATILKVHNALINSENIVNVWGSGNQRREWMFVEDFVDCIIWSLENLENTKTFLNVGPGEDISMNDLTNLVITKFNHYFGDKCDFFFRNMIIKNDLSKPEGMQKKLLDVSKINQLGWKTKTSLDEGISKTIKYFMNRSK